MIRALLFVLLVCIGTVVTAQTNTLSPYSIYGLGDAPYSSMASLAGMSHTGIGMLSTLNINVVNPATQTFITRPTFNVGFRDEYITLNNSGQSQSGNLLSIENISFAFPLINNSKIRRRSSLSFGLTPYSRQGYNIVTNQTVDGLGDVEYRFLGEGGINSAFLSGSFELIADSGRVNTLGIGVTGSYVFGTISRNRITTVDSNVRATNLYREESNEVSSADVKIGLLYTRKLVFNKGTEDQLFAMVSGGVYYKPSLSLNSFNNETSYTFVNNFRNPVIVDTVSMTTSNEPIIAPSSYGLGFAFTYDDRWNVGLDISTTLWSQLEINGVNAGLNDERRISLGVEYVPDPAAYKRIFKTIRYRAGISAEQTRLNVMSQQPNRIGVSAGLGIPIIASKSSSIFNIGTEYAVRGATGLPVSESMLNVYVGITITPNQYDRWFVKRKYD